VVEVAGSTAVAVDTAADTGNLELTWSSPIRKKKMMMNGWQRALPGRFIFAKADSAVADAGSFWRKTGCSLVSAVQANRPIPQPAFLARMCGSGRRP